MDSITVKEKKMKKWRKTVRDNALREMEERGINMLQVANKTNISYTFVRYVILGKRNCTVDTLEKIAKGMGLTLSEILEEAK